MMKSILSKLNVVRDKVVSSESLRWLQPLLKDPYLFHLNRHSVTWATAIGLGVGILPIFGQTPLAALLAIWRKANVALSLLFIWISNPITFPIILVGEYWLGNFILGKESAIEFSEFDPSSVMAFIEEIWKPLLVGGTSAALIFAILGFVTVDIAWRASVYLKWKSRRQLSRLKKTPGS